MTTNLARLIFWRNSSFIVMLVGYIGYYLIRANLSAAVPLIGETFHYTNEQLGVIGFTSEIAYALGKFINGPLGDRVGGKRIFLLGMAGAIFFNFIFSQMHSLLGFVVVWCLVRYFLSMGWGGVVKTIGAWFEPERNGRVMGFISINFQFGGVLAALFAGALVKMGSDWKGLFIYPALVVSVILVWSYFGAKENPQEVVPGTNFGQGQNNKKSLLHQMSRNVDNPTGMNSNGRINKKHSTRSILFGLWQIPLFKHLLVFAFLTTFLRSIFMFWIAKFLVDLGMKNESAIINSALFPLMGCLGTLFIGWYTDTRAKNGNRARMMWIMLGILTLCLLSLAYLVGNETKDFNLIVALLGASGFFLLGPYSMSAGALTLDIAGPEAAASCAGIIDGFGYIGGALATWVAGKISYQLGWSAVFLVLAACALASVFSAVIMSLNFQKSVKQTQ